MKVVKVNDKMSRNEDSIQKLSQIINFWRENYNITHDKTYNLAKSGIAFSFGLVEQEIKHYLHVRT